MADKQMAHSMPETFDWITASWTPMNRRTLRKEEKLVEILFRDLSNFTAEGRSIVVACCHRTHILETTLITICKEEKR
jgi:hypothetical protein